MQFGLLRYKHMRSLIRAVSSALLVLSSNALMAEGFPVAPADKALLQQLLDQHTHIILESQGDYRGALPKLVMSSGQTIEGGFGTVVPTVEIPAGVSNVTIEGVLGVNLPGATVVFTGEGSSGEDRTNYDVTIIGGSNGRTNNSRLFIKVSAGAQVERLRATYIGGVEADLTVSGFIRNSVFQGIAGRGKYVNVYLTGNTATPSYGNAILGLASTQPIQAANVSDFGDLYLIGADVENWSCFNSGPYESQAFSFDNMDAVRMVGPSGGPTSCATFSQGAMTKISNTSKVATWFDRSVAGPADTIDEYFDNVGVYVETQRKTNVADSFTNNPPDQIQLRALSGNPPATVSGAPAENDLEKQNAVMSALLGRSLEGAPDLPQVLVDNDPLGSHWSDDLGDPNDCVTWQALQDQIDKSTAEGGGVLRLQPGTYYLCQPLQIGNSTRIEGIIGSGKNEVFLIPRDITKPVIKGRRTGSGDAVSIVLEGISIYGGTYGIDFSVDTFSTHGQLSWSSFRNVRFSRQSNAGVNVDGVGGMDNNVWYNVDFVEMPIAFRGVSGPVINGVAYWHGSSYADKQYFIGNRYTNISDTVWSWDSRRHSGHHIWIDAYYHTVGKVSRTRAAYNLLWVNSVFRDVTGGVGGVAIDLLETAAQPSTYYFTQVGCEWKGEGPPVVTDSQGPIGTLFIDTHFHQTNGSIVAPTGNQVFHAWNSEICINELGQGALVGNVQYGSFVNSKLRQYDRKLTYVQGGAATHVVNTTAQPYRQVLPR